MQIPTLSSINHNDGRVRLFQDGVRGEEWRWHYNIKDHLGNVRVVFSDLDRDLAIHNADEILEEYQYFPFGLSTEGPWNSIPEDEEENRYRYNGKGADS